MKLDIGRKGEEIARKYLIKNKYTIIITNFRKPWGEIDIVAKDHQTKELVFVEVKTRNNIGLDSVLPEEELTSEKVRRLKRIFLSYLGKSKQDIPWRFDLIAIVLNKLPSSSPIIKHYKNIFLQF